MSSTAVSLGKFARFKRWLATKAVSIAEYPSYFARARDEIDSDVGSGVNITMPYAQSVWVYGAVSLIARSVASTPFRFETSHGNFLESGPQVEYFNRPNPQQTGRQFIEELVTVLLLDGHAMIEHRGLNGMQPKSSHVQSLRDVYADIRQDDLLEDFAFRWIRKSNQEPLIPNDEIFVWRLYNPYNNVYGLSPLQAGYLAIYSDVATGVFNRSFFENGAQPGVIFTTDNEAFTQEQAEQAQNWWNAKRRGARNSHKVAFLGNNLRPYNVNSTHADMEFPTLKQLSKSEILAIYHVPETLLGALSPQTGVTIGGSDRKPDAENFYLNNVMPMADKVADFLNLTIGNRFGNAVGRFDFSNTPVLLDRQLDRAKEAREWVKAGIPVNEVNRVFDLGYKEQEHGNEFWLPGNMAPARLLMNGPLTATGIVSEPGVDKEEA